MESIGSLGLWATFSAIVVFMLAVDLFVVGGGRQHRVSFREAATWSVLVKTGFLYLIMVTGAIWEKVVFGQYLFAPAFFWEDLFSFVVIALHTLYLWALVSGAVPAKGQLLIALAAYAAYVVNAGQFLLKLRAARLGGVAA